MSDSVHPDPPSPFVLHWAPVVARQLETPRRALDVAMGRGRHVAALADAGFDVFGVDVRREAVADAVRQARSRGAPLSAWVADLTRVGLPRDRFELVLVTRYLQRDLFAGIRAAVVHGGFVVYETFTERKRELGRHPRSAEHLLKPGELRASFADFDLLFYEEVVESEAVARLVARRLN